MTDHTLGHLRRKFYAQIGSFSSKLGWLPIYLCFQLHGHKHAWQIFTHMTSEERLLLYWLGRQQPRGGNFLEIGSYLGASSCFLAAAAMDIGGVKIHCVDTWQNEGMSEGLRDTWAEFKKNVEPFSSLVVTHRGLSTEIAKTFNNKIDLLFVDGDHSYEACRADVEAWFPHMKQGGVLVMHDYGWAEGVRQVVEKIVKPRQSQEGHVLQNTYWTHL